MLYVNSKTGASFYSSVPVRGGDWTLVEQQTGEKAKTVAEIKRQLDAAGIKYSSKAKKPELEALLPG
ncbi:hypothetical protein E0F59_10240 [Streptococcus pyogenes]|uniref:hypothetical protein n=1 Tax=Streptococcus pyogenes TaxID=1314 RepID=UPI0011E7BB08|nr:hypothetical protein [Streptococcus pyogenes]TYK87523.1 hypothetical protein E0F59_10240 [Streptococcus pyogenes]